jgi:hypothetical protein
LLPFYRVRLVFIGVLVSLRELIKTYYDLLLFLFYIYPHKSREPSKFITKHNTMYDGREGTVPHPHFQS